jgi:hypothetical protein
VLRLLAVNAGRPVHRDLLLAALVHERDVLRTQAAECAMAAARARRRYSAMPDDLEVPAR